MSAHVTQLSTTPIKGLALHHPAAIELTASGAVGDRDFFLIDPRDRLVSIKATGRLVDLVADYDAHQRRLRVAARDGEVWEDDVTLGERVEVDFFDYRLVAGRVVEGPWAAMFSGRAKRPLRLVQAEDRGAGSDVHPVTLLAQESVAELARRAGVTDVDPRRFRMLIDFAGARPHEEDHWRDQIIEVGTARLRVGGPVPRCAGTTRDPDRGDRDLPVVRMIRGYRGVAETELGPGVCFGVYARVLQPGTVRVGDTLQLVAA